MTDPRNGSGPLAKGPIAYMAANHVAANILMLIFLVGGLIMSRTLKQEVFPEFELDLVTVTVAYPGATPEEVEDAVVRPVELAVSGIDNVKRVRASALEGIGTVTVEVLEGADTDQVVQDVKSEVDRIQTIPEEAERPIITKLTNRNEVITLLVHGQASPRALQEMAEGVRDDLLASPGITQADIAGAPDYEISVEIPEANLRKYGLTLDRVASIIRRSSLDLAGGSIKDEGGEVLVRTTEKRFTGGDFDSVEVFTLEGGRRVLLSEIAEVKDTFAELDQAALLDGERAVMVRVFRVGDQKPTEISEEVRAYVRERNDHLPAGVGLLVYQDRSDILQQRMDLLMKNGILGLVFVLIVLALFLEIRLAFWVALGIVIAFLGAFIFLPGFDVSINMISLFAFLIILGVVVDDAIVVGENIFVHRRMGKSWLRAAVDGTREVSMAVVFAGLTTMAAFGPLLFVGGFAGKFMGVIPTIVITVLAISLIEALFILPSHLSGGLVASRRPIWERIERVRGRFDRFVRWLIDHSYAGTLARAQRNPAATIAIALALLLIAVGFVRGGIIKFVFMPEIEADEVVASLQMPPGTPFDATRAHALRMQRHAEEILRESDAERADGGSNLRHIFTLLGQQLDRRGQGRSGSSFGANLAQIRVLLDDPGRRSINSAAFASEWRRRVGEIPGAERLNFQSELISRGADLEIQLSHADYSVLLTAVDRLRQSLSDYAGVREVMDSHSDGKRELKLQLRPEASTLGISERDLAVQVRSAFFGAEALRIQRGQNEVKVMVRYPEEDRRTLASIQQLRVRTPEGREIPLPQAAWIEEGRGYNSINRTDRRRVVTVSANLDRKAANADEILADLRQGTLRQLLSDYPGLSYDLEGSSRDQRDTFRDIGTAFLFGLFLIYGLLAVPFRSFIQPFVVMSAIPFGVVGAIGGHVLLGYNLSMISMFGIVALTGVVVNSSLVLIDFINRRRRDGAPLPEAILEAGKRRFRPIVMTSVTTFVGLTPMILETSIQAQFLVPMAISLGFGVLFSTAITLVLVPVLYTVMEGAVRSMRRTVGMAPEEDDVAGDLTAPDGIRDAAEPAQG